jgi:hypothetical protein
LDLLPILDGTFEVMLTSSERLVPGRVANGTARPFTGRSSIL